MKADDVRLDWIRAYAEGTADATTVRSLETELSADPALRSLFLEYLNIDGSLGLHAMGTAIRQSASALPYLRSSWIAAAAGIAVTVALVWFIAARPIPCAMMLEARNARWENSTLPTAPGSSLQVGALRLTDGLAQLRFSSGAEVTMEGPAELEILGPKLCRLHRGSLVAHVPVSAHGFTVCMENATLIDHGTDFGLSADGAGHGKVHVMRGEVELRHASGQPPLRLSTHEMAAITPEKLLPAMPLENEPRRLSEPAESLTFTSEITTRAGRGAAAYVSEPRTGRNQSATLLLLKHCAEPGYGRKVLLRFDLSELPDAASISNAKLTFSLAPSGFGYASHGGDARVVVYALTDHTSDLWNASEVNWNTQPAFHSSAGRVDASKAVRVGEFLVPLGVQSGAFSIEGSKLIEHIKTNPHRLLTLILVRENRIEQGGGLVLGIAGNNHPTLQPPTLHIR